MPQTESAIMTPATQKKADAHKEKQKMMKQALKEAKANASAAKKAVAEKQKAFTSEPTTDHGKDYKAAVSDHVKAVKEVDKWATKLAA